LSNIELTKFLCFKKARYSDLVSVLGMVSCEDEAARDALEYCLTGTRRNLKSWGHEYLRCLAGQIGQEYESKQEKGEDCDQIIELVA
jgi:26S proteasome regulatory subunit N1